jgi:hypothetical protein
MRDDGDRDCGGIFLDPHGGDAARLLTSRRQSRI